jgi:nucleoside-diphosphate-sugar epimerase
MKILVAGAGGFIGGHLVNKLESLGHDLVAVDIKNEENWFIKPKKSELIVADLRLLSPATKYTKDVSWIFNLACDMGGMGFIENNKAKCMESVLINTHLLQSARENNVEKFFFSSSACVYASFHQNSLEIEPLKEVDAYPADPEDGYGWEKLFSERMCRHFDEDYGIKTRVARYHNVYGPYGTYVGGREKVPAAACRKIIESINNGTYEIEIWGDGKQLRSFTYIEDCIEGTLKLMDSDFNGPLNIGSPEMISINNLYASIIEVKNLDINKFNFKHNLNAPQGVRGRSSNNDKCLEVLNWEPSVSFKTGISKTYDWILKEINS